ncbi:hypothetical protein NSS64_21425 [Paenibacillus sp. FSL H8-0122]|uniref:hypothetical protein n=1 Tax=Paenibacillus sp. FSL H8-0122 TaxID=2954510 RepID=UPI0030F83B34
MKRKLIADINEGRKIFKYNHLIIVGENNSGKSKMLRDLMKEIGKKSIYFIDSTNRTIPNKRTEIRKSFGDLKIDELLSTRLKEENFNSRDIFTDLDGNELVLNELFVNFDKYKLLFNEILKIEIAKLTEETQLSDITQNEEFITFNGDKLDVISNGIQAMARITMEVEFAHCSKCEMIFIDEINMNLDHKNSWIFIESLKAKYPEAKFIITCHSPYTLLGISDFDILKINKLYKDIDDNLIEIFDSNDLDNTEIIDRKIFRGERKRDEKDIILSNCTKLVILGEELHDDQVTALKSLNGLSIRQEVILNYIKERSGKL